MQDVRKWRVTANYYRGENAESSYSFTITLANLYDAYAKGEISTKDNYLIADCVYNFAMIKARGLDMADIYPLMSMEIKPV